MVEKMLMVCGVILAFGVYTYPKWSWKRWAKDCEQDVIPYTGRKKIAREVGVSHEGRHK